MPKTLFTLLLVLLVSAGTGPIWAAEAAAESADSEVAAVAAAGQEVRVSKTELEAAEACAAPDSDATLDSIARFEVTAQAEARGEACGGVFCSFGTYCCNPTCNACVPFGWGCTQEVCNFD